ncbi:MAG TPA: nucleoside triphosphate pyrophosphohydrolase family protein [Candidatus Bathyarchaeia archaeon]|nr:nucleoside triphosphate pyrophosphohydrolase family protein [Candidatus Bathyarchaeia archaeon]
MNKQQRMVKDWHRKFGVLINEYPKMIDKETQYLRVSLMREEFQEFDEACAVGDIVKVADALGDLLYVVYGSAVSFGIDLEPVFDEIHRSNMSKGDPEVIKAPTGKVLRNKNYSPPDLASLILKQIRSGS